MKIDTQDSVLALLLRSPDFLMRRLSDLSAGHFTTAERKITFTLIHEFFWEYERPPLKKELAGVIWDGFQSGNILDVWKRMTSEEEIEQYIWGLYQFDLDPKWVEDNLGSHLRMIATKDFLNDQIQQFETTGQINPMECLDRLESIVQVGLSVDDVTDLDYTIDTLGEDEERVVVCPTPWPTINSPDYMDGGLAVGEYGCILAYPNVGKSTMLACIGAEALLHGKNVLHISIEDSAVSVQKRYIASLTNVPRSRMTKELSAEKAKSLYKQMRENNEIGKLHILQFEEYAKKASELIHVILKNERKTKTTYDVIIVDYLQLMKPEKGEKGDFGQGGWEAQEDTHRMFRRVMTKLKKAGWSALQAREDSVVRVPILQLHNIGKAKAVGQVPDFLVSLNETKELTEDGSLVSKLYVARNRLGKKYAVLDLKTDIECCMYEEIKPKFFKSLHS